MKKQVKKLKNNEKAMMDEVQNKFEQAEIGDEEESEEDDHEPENVL